MSAGRARGGRGGAEEGIGVPAAVCVADQVYAGLVDTDAIEREPAAPEGEEPDGGDDGIGVEKGLCAVGRVFIDGEVREDESRARKEAELDSREADGPAEGAGDKLDDVAFIAADADIWRNEDKKQDENDNAQAES
jgi:hypothetical protein